jgi:hypothetical protein
MPSGADWSAVDYRAGSGHSSDTEPQRIGTGKRGAVTRKGRATRSGRTEASKTKRLDPSPLGIEPSFEPLACTARGPNR